VRSVQLDLTIPDRSPADVYATLADFERYPEYAPAVRSVTTIQSDGTQAEGTQAEGTQSDGRVSVSRWEVSFRRGILRWVEEDTFDPVGLSIVFRQLEGDIALFEGSWSCTASGDGTAVVFAARLDMGIPSLADALEPIAARTLVDNTVAIVSGLFDGRSIVEHVNLEGPAAPVSAGALAAGSRS